MIRLTEAEIKRVIKDTRNLPLQESYEALCQAQLEKVAYQLAHGLPVDEIEKEARI